MADPAPDTGDDIGTPRWAKVSGIIVIILVLLVVVMMFTGHGPGRHIPRGDTPAFSVTKSMPANHAPPESGQ